jgi:flagellar biosynthesis protein FlhA
MGLVIGVATHGMPLGQAFETYAILTVGDGLVTQIPAVVISIASALLLARGGATGATDLTLLRQMGKYPPALGTVAFLMGLFALVPGLPFLPFVAGAAILGTSAYSLSQSAKREAADALRAPEEELSAPREKPMGDVLDIDEIHVEFAPDLVSMVLDPGTGLEARIANMRNHVATVFGLILPEMRLTDDPALQPGTYVVRIHGVEQVRDRLQPDRMLALHADNADALPPGDDVKEPVYGAPSRWIDPAAREDAALSGVTVVAPSEVLATHLLEVIKRNFPRLLTLKALRRLLDEMVNLTNAERSEANRKMLDDLIPDKVPLDILHSVLRLLLEERVSIRNLPLILEATAEARGLYPTVDGICEHVRQRLGFQLVADMRRPDGTIPLVQLAQDWEEIFSTYQMESDKGQLDVALPPEEFNRLANSLAERINQASEMGVYPAVVTSTRRRRFLRTVMAAKGMANPVLSFEEIGMEARPSLVGMVAA